MIRVGMALVAALIGTGLAFAQSANPYNGEWTITFDTPMTASVRGAILIKDEGGTWDIVARSAKNPCLGREYPITIDKAAPDELTFTVQRAKTLTGCTDSTYTFKKIDDKTLKGEVGGGRPAVMVRK